MLKSKGILNNFGGAKVFWAIALAELTLLDWAGRLRAHLPRRTWRENTLLRDFVETPVGRFNILLFGVYDSVAMECPFVSWLAGHLEPA